MRALHLPRYPQLNVDGWDEAREALIKGDVEPFRNLLAVAPEDLPRGQKAILETIRLIVDEDWSGALKVELPEDTAPPERLALSFAQAWALLYASELETALETANATIEQARLHYGPRDQRYFTFFPAMRTIARTVEQHTAGRRSKLRHLLKIDSIDPVHYLISYPRSGNTMLTQAIEAIFATPHFSVFPADGLYFSRRLFRGNNGRPAIVKDHILRSEYLKDSVTYVVRDGRDVVLSLAYYTYAEGLHNLIGDGQLADFMHWLNTKYEFGFWAENVRLALEAAELSPAVRIVKYEDLLGNYDRIASLFADIGGERAGNYDSEAICAHIEKSRAGFKKDRLWGYGAELPANSYLSAEWQKNRGGSNWRAIFDARAKEVFHKLSGTDILVALGYETDPNWWTG